MQESVSYISELEVGRGFQMQLFSRQVSVRRRWTSKGFIRYVWDAMDRMPSVGSGKAVLRKSEDIAASLCVLLIEAES